MYKDISDEFDANVEQAAKKVLDELRSIIQLTTLEEQVLMRSVANKYPEQGKMQLFSALAHVRVHTNGAFQRLAEALNTKDQYKAWFVAQRALQLDRADIAIALKAIEQQRSQNGLRTPYETSLALFLRQASTDTENLIDAITVRLAILERR